MAANITDKHIRTQLINQGAGSLTDAELLSILLREGAGNLSAVETAERLLTEFKNLSEMGTLSVAELRVKGELNVSQAAAIAAAAELGKRYRIGEGMQKNSIVCLEDILDIFQPELAGLDHEEFWAIFLNTAGKVIDRIRISQGGIRGTVVDYQLVVKRGIDKLAQGIIIVHNHPSGNPTPSGEDNNLTEKLWRAFRLFNMVLLDHVIIARDKYYSFREAGFIDNLKNDI